MWEQHVSHVGHSCTKPCLPPKYYIVFFLIRSSWHGQSVTGMDRQDLHLNAHRHQRYLLLSPLLFKLIFHEIHGNGKQTIAKYLQTCLFLTLTHCFKLNKLNSQVSNFLVGGEVQTKCRKFYTYFKWSIIKSMFKSIVKSMLRLWLNLCSNYQDQESIRLKIQSSKVLC